jgi:hypothetical protein
VKPTIDAQTLAPLWAVAEADPDAEIRLAALDAASRLPLNHDGWRQYAACVRTIIVSEPAGSPARRTALSLAVRAPLLSVRHHLRTMAARSDDRDRDAVAEALDAARDPARIGPLLKQARSDRGESFEKLAAMRVEDEGLTPADIPPLPGGAVADAPLWRALLLARLGDFAALDAIYEGADPEPELFWGSPWTAYNAIAAMQPVPSRMRTHLLDAAERLGNSERGRMAQLIAWAATGVADAQGSPIEPLEATDSADIRVAPPPSPELVKQAAAATTKLPSRLFEGTLSAGEIDVLVHLPPKRFATLLTATVAEANKRARALPPDAPANMMLGNEVIRVIPSAAPTAHWPVAELVLEHVTTARPALDDEQMAWLIARDRPAQLIDKMMRVLGTERPAAQRVRLLKLLGSAADHQAGRGAAPARGAGPTGTEPPTTASLIDDMPRAAARAAPEEPEERRVHAQIRHDGRSRRTFVAGADNVIRCWIGVPEPERAAVASTAIPQVAIPPEGLKLTVELYWGDQTDRKELVLPAERSARTGDCDLRLHVPDDERHVSAALVFRFRGRVFEVVHVEAFALAAGAEESADHTVRVRVQVSRREVIDLPESRAFDAVVIWGSDDSRSAPDAPAPSPSLRVFGGEGGKGYDLRDAGAAIKWLNDKLFATEKSLVRRRAAQTGTDEVLDAADAELLGLLRDMARNGANLYNELRDQGFDDPGERIQLLNMQPDSYVPLEFVYDRGYPADNARLCDGWLAALTGESGKCPTCSGVEIPKDQRHWVPVICPLGFWSLQKIIERLDGDGHPSAPRRDRLHLPIIDTTVFASSHRVPEEERQTTWQALRHSFQSPVLAHDWEEWKEAVKQHPSLLVVLPHHEVKDPLDCLQIGDEQLPAERGQLSRGQLTEIYVNPDRQHPGPIMLLLGCRTAASIEGGYVHLARRFQRHTSIVVGTLAEILGRHAAPVARELVTQLVAVNDPEADFGSIMRRVRRRMLAKGYVMALCLVALGDAQWRLTPRPPSATPV